jgi:ferredoxin
MRLFHHDRQGRHYRLGRLTARQLSFGGYYVGRLKTTVNKAKCIGSEDCIQTAPGVFQLDNEGKSEVYNDKGATDNVILAAARGCPAKAIIVVDEDTGSQLFPTQKK